MREPKAYFPFLLFLLLLLFILLVDRPFYLNMIFMILLFAGLSGAWNILGGFGGQLSLGHSAFFGLGAYTRAFSSSNAESLPSWACLRASAWRLLWPL